MQSVRTQHGPGLRADGGRGGNARPDGLGYDYFGINEVIYSGEGKFRLMYSIPDLFGLARLYKSLEGRRTARSLRRTLPGPRPL